MITFNAKLAEARLGRLPKFAREFSSRLDRQSHDRAIRLVAGMMNDAKQVARRMEGATADAQKWSPGLGLYALRGGQAPDGANADQRYRHLGLERQEAHNLIYPSGVFPVKMRVNYNEDQTAERAKAQPKLPRPDLSQDILLFTTRFSKQHQTGMNFVERVWDVDHTIYDDSYHPFVMLFEVVGAMEDDKPVLSDEGFKCIEDMCFQEPENGGNGYSIWNTVCLGDKSDVTGRGGWWSQNKEFWNQRATQVDYGTKGPELPVEEGEAKEGEDQASETQEAPAGEGLF